MSSLKRLSNPASLSSSSLYLSFAMTPVKKYRNYEEKRNNISRNNSRANITPNASRPVSQNR